MDRNFESYKNYVCPLCFHQLHECTCKTFPPYSLLFIDEGIQRHIRALKSKGYITVGCCEGHYKSYSAEPYIAFGMDYDFKKIPRGFKWNKRRRMIVSDKINAKSENEYNIKKQEQLKCLMDWIESI